MSENSQQKSITKAALIAIIESWGKGQISIEKLQLWMLDNFEPDEFAIGAGESESVVEAMHIVMNEFELVDGEKCILGQYRLALDFINCDEQNFISRKNDFLRNAFLD